MSFLEKQNVCDANGPDCRTHTRNDKSVRRRCSLLSGRYHMADRYRSASVVPTTVGSLCSFVRVSRVLVVADCESVDDLLGPCGHHSLHERTARVVVVSFSVFEIMY